MSFYIYQNVRHLDKWKHQKFMFKIENKDRFNAVALNINSSLYT